MTKSKGIGRGGVRKGSGRRPAISKVDWEALGRAYFSGKSVEVRGAGVLRARLDSG
jgi:hypothetical protein